MKDKWGYIDRNGKIAINPQFGEAELFSQGLAAVKVKDKWGYIDRSGTLMVVPQFEFADGFKGGLAAVAVYQWGLDWIGWIDRTGKYVWSPSILKVPDEPSDDQYSKTMKSDLRNLVTAEEAYFADSVKYVTPVRVPNYALTAEVSFTGGARRRRMAGGPWCSIRARPGSAASLLVAPVGLAGRCVKRSRGAGRASRAHDDLSQV